MNKNPIASRNQFDHPGVHRVWGQFPIMRIFVSEGGVHWMARYANLNYFWLGSVESPDWMM